MKTFLKDGRSLQATLNVYALSMTNKAGASDFDGGSATQTITLDSIENGDVILSGDVQANILTTFVHAGTLTLAVGITGTLDRFIAATSVLGANNTGLVPTVAANHLPYINNSGSAVNLLATLVASTTVGATTAGEVLIAVPFLRNADRITRMKT